jgi:hypothetical protein
VKRLSSVMVCLLLVTGCGLPLGGGVREPGQVPAEERQAGDIQVLPPGPRDDASAADIVRDFFGAQSSPDDAHASAREFLAPEIRARWRDDARVGVLDANGLSIDTVLGQPNSLRVTGVVVAVIDADGSYTAVREVVDEQVQVRRGPRGRWLITKVSDGLLLSAADRERSFHARSIYFLAPPSAPEADASRHLVPDQVFLPVTADNADGLVRRLLAGPSKLLGDSVSTAFPVGTRVRSVRTDASGLVTVDVTAQAGRASAQLREQMSAQLVWTLRGTTFSAVRLLSVGRPVPSGSGDHPEERDRNDWQPYDPDGLSSRPPLYYVSGRRLRLLEPVTAPVSAASQRTVVDGGAASPRGGGLALVTRTTRGMELSTGPANGPFVVRSRARTISFLSWGSGEQGVWFLQNGRVKLAPLSGSPVDVPVDGLGNAGPIAGVRVSRDGVRVGLITGIGSDRRLRVGRIAERAGAFRIIDVRSVAAGVQDVRDLTWDTATSLTVLGRAAGLSGPIRIAVDGSSVALVARIGFDAGTQPLAVAAAPNQPLVVAALLGTSFVLYRASGTNRYVRERGISGAEPFYPG